MTALLLRFKTSLQHAGKAPATIRSYTYDVQQFLIWAKHNQLSLENISSEDASAYLQFLKNKKHELRPGKWGHYQPGTVRKKIVTLRLFFDFIGSEQ
ncbi:MAG: site-specific integrase [Anaerolineae bacterium]|jgi:site-specific recombinase XerD|nr:site-specific integrase [Anaerolineae bacterium]MBT7191790.1 site-specific integrase [Anaerolineae bacterium]MBT7776019.1 site-specific integrase [Anaerolineae bacterium]